MLEKNLNIVGPGKKAEDDDNDEGRDEKKIDERAPISGVRVCVCVFLFVSKPSKPSDWIAARALWNGTSWAAKFSLNEYHEADITANDAFKGMDMGGWIVVHLVWKCVHVNFRHSLDGE